MLSSRYQAAPIKPWAFLLTSSAHMRAAAILGLGCSPKQLKPFQDDNTVEWRLGLPSSADHADAILIFGGDGTIHRHLSQLVKLGKPVLVIPAGSGNDFATALGLTSMSQSLVAWKNFRQGAAARHIDLGVITPLHTAAAQRDVAIDDSVSPHYFCCVAGVGLDAEVARRANQLPRWLRGHGGYALTLMPTIFRFAPMPMKIITAENAARPESWTIRSDQRTMLAAFANAPFYGGGMKIAPQATVDDGMLDVCVVAGVNPFKLFCMFPTVYSGRHLHIKEVNYFQAPRVRIETEHPHDIYADGEYVCRTPAEIAIQPRALQVIAA